MIHRPNLLPCILLLLCSTLLGSCFMFDSDLLAPARALTEHESVCVRSAAIAGATLGGVAGIPLVVAGLPLTLPPALMAGSGDMLMALPFAPALATAGLGSVLLGGPTWLICGWW